ncbi:MAG: CHAD domain-containing protein [Kineosporiaceae bacterium]|nr:CHAD domain-containing protein [Aeromicrobium sp.]
MTIPFRAFRAADKQQLELGEVVAALSVRFTVATGTKHLVRRARLDTFDRRLLEAGLTLEHQTVASGQRLVLGRLKEPSPLAVSVTKLQWPALADRLPNGPLREAIAGVSGIRALMVISDERRSMRVLDLNNEEGKTVARVEFDEPAPAAIAAGDTPAQLTIRSLRGYDQEARRATQLLTGLGLQAVETDEGREPGSIQPIIGMDRGAPGSELITKALNAYLVAMRENLPGLLDNVDTEFLHDFRVAVRRTRAALKLGRPCLPGEMRTRWEPAFKWLGDLTTPVRDLDVYELDLPAMAGWLVAAKPTDLEPFEAHLRSRRVAKRRTLVRGLRSDKFTRLVGEWDEELAQMGSLPQDVGPEHPSAGQTADRGISRAYRRVLGGGGAISNDSPAEDLHTLRKNCKELRYALEVCAPVIAKSPRKRVVADLKGLQDVLGRFQDSEVQRQALHGFAEEMMADGTPAAAVLAMGELIGHLEAEQGRARREFDGAFAHFARPSSQRLMHTLGGRT